MTENEGLLILLHLSLGRAKIIKLLGLYENSINILNSEEPLILGWNKLDTWKKDLENVEKEKVFLLSFKDIDYPAPLLQTPSFPLLLYVKGTIEGKGLGIVGTRNASLYGKEMAFSLSHSLALNGFTIVSGLARGIDTAAHQGALKGGKTIAVLGSGLSYLYPKENKELAEKIAEKGALVSEFPMSTPPHKHLFPRRNRIISGLAEGVLLVESPLKGGAMITMELAYEQGKRCFALPGRADAPTFKGNHALIKEQKALLIEGAEEIARLYDVALKECKASFTLCSLNPEEKKIIAHLSQEKSAEELVLLTQLPVMKLNILLTSLILKKAIKELPGKVYKII